MDRELEKYYEEQFNLFSTQGYKDLIEQVQEMYDSNNEVSVIKDAEELYKTQGKLDILAWLLSWQQLVESSYKNLQSYAEKDL